MLNYYDIAPHINGLLRSKAAATKLINAYNDRNTVSQLETRYLRPFAFNDDTTNPYAIAFQDGKKATRRHYAASDLKEHNFDFDRWQYYELFTNPINWKQHKANNYNSPSSFPVIVGYEIFTIEIDINAIEAFETQLKWFLCGRKSPVSLFHKKLRETFADYCGLTAVWSGNKSFHFHFGFDTHTIAGVEQRLIKDGIAAAWKTLSEAFAEHFNLASLPPLNGDQWEIDDLLKSRAHLRRLPRGVRVIDKENIFGFPNTALIFQCVLFDEWVDRAAPSAVFNSFFDQRHFSDGFQSKVKARTNGKGSGTKVRPNTDKEQFLIDKLNAALPDKSPTFYRFGYEGSAQHQSISKAIFKAYDGDGKPDSVMLLEYPTILISGNDPNGFGDANHRFNVFGNITFGDMLAQWSAEYENENPDPNAYYPDPNQTALEAAFSEAAVSHQAARDAFTKTLAAAMGYKPDMLWLCAPEGLGKSQALFAEMAKLNPSDGFVLFASATYAMAEEQCDNFNRSQNGWTGIVLKSITQAYASAAEQIASIYNRPAAAFPSAADRIRCKGTYADAIRLCRPDEFRLMGEYYLGVREQIREHNGRVVLFITHDTAQLWHDKPSTRLALSKHYWTVADRNERQAKVNKTAKFTEAQLIVHDEIAVSHLITKVAQDTIDIIAELGTPDKHFGDMSVSEQFDIFTSNKDILAEAGLTDFDELRRLAKLKTQPVEVKFNAELGERHDDNDMYRKAVKPHRFAYRDWFTKTRTIVLTTELVPTNVARHIKQQNFVQNFEVVELKTPRIKSDYIGVIASTYLSAKQQKRTDADGKVFYPQASVVKAINKFDSDYPTTLDTLLVSNGVRDFNQGIFANSITHHSVKGSNAHTGKRIVQTQLFCAAEVYAEYEVINAIIGRDDCVRTYYLDTISQTAGRNLGFRKVGDAEHFLIIHKALYAQLHAMDFRYIFKPLNTK